jgi:nucleotide-binding universal stress UspA family protein
MKPKNILIPLSNPEYLEDMLRIACHLANVYKGNIITLYVIEIPRSLELDVEMKEEMEKAEKILKNAYDFASSEYGIEIETDILQARTAGPAIVKEIVDKKIDLVILEAPLKKGVEEKFFGSTVEYLLEKAPCKVLFIRPFVEEEI